MNLNEALNILNSTGHKCNKKTISERRGEGSISWDTYLARAVDEHERDDDGYSDDGGIDNQHWIERFNEWLTDKYARLGQQMHIAMNYSWKSKRLRTKVTELTFPESNNGLQKVDAKVNILLDGEVVGNMHMLIDTQADNNPNDESDFLEWCEYHCEFTSPYIKHAIKDFPFFWYVTPKKKIVTRDDSGNSSETEVIKDNAVWFNRFPIIINLISIITSGTIIKPISFTNDEFKTYVLDNMVESARYYTEDDVDLVAKTVEEWLDENYAESLGDDVVTIRGHRDRTGRRNSDEFNHTAVPAEEDLEEATRIVRKNGLRAIREAKKLAGPHPVFSSKAFQDYLIKECGEGCDCECGDDCKCDCKDGKCDCDCKDGKCDTKKKTYCKKCHRLVSKCICK